MKKLLLTLSLLSIKATTLEYVKQFENEKTTAAYVKIMPQEVIGDHYDQYPAIVVALKGGTITRLEADGSTTRVEFPTGQSVFRPAETPAQMHKSVNEGAEPIELIIVQLK